MRSVQVPLAALPSSVARLPSGRKLPVKGALPLVIEVAASSSRRVLV
jgi:hypothetical protein